MSVLCVSDRSLCSTGNVIVPSVVVCFIVVTAPVVVALDHCERVLIVTIIVAC